MNCPKCKTEMTDNPMYGDYSIEFTCPKCKYNYDEFMGIGVEEMAKVEGSPEWIPVHKPEEIGGVEMNGYSFPGRDRVNAEEYDRKHKQPKSSNTIKERVAGIVLIEMRNLLKGTSAGCDKSTKEYADQAAKEIDLLYNAPADMTLIEIAKKLDVSLHDAYEIEKVVKAERKAEIEKLIPLFIADPNHYKHSFEWLEGHNHAVAEIRKRLGI